MVGAEAKSNWPRATPARIWQSRAGCSAAAWHSGLTEPESSTSWHWQVAFFFYPCRPLAHVGTYDTSLRACRPTAAAILTRLQQIAQDFS